MGRCFNSLVLQLAEEAGRRYAKPIPVGLQIGHAVRSGVSLVEASNEAAKDVSKNPACAINMTTRRVRLQAVLQSIRITLIRHE